MANARSRRINRTSIRSARTPQFEQIEPRILLSAVAIAEDVYEQNDSIDQAADLGAFTTHGNRIDNLTMDNSANEATRQDWYSFTIAATGLPGDQVSIEFQNALGDLNMALVGVSNGTTYLVKDSAGQGDSEVISLAGVPKGQYFLEVYADGTTTSPDYSIVVDAPLPLTGIQQDAYENNDSKAAAHPLGELTGHGYMWTDMTMDDSGSESHREDWYSFTTAGAGLSGDSVSINFLNARGDLDLQLVDGAGTALASSETSGDGENVSLAGLAAGTYYVRVFGADSATNPQYSLTIDAPYSDSNIAPDQYEDNDTAQTATDLGKLAGGTRFINGLSMDDADWYQFSLQNSGTQASQIEVVFNGALGDIDAELYDMSGNLLASSTSDNNSEVIPLATLKANTSYRLRVFGALGDVNPQYALSIAAPYSSKSLPEWTILAYLDGDDTPSGISGSSLEQDAINKLMQSDLGGMISGAPQMGILIDFVNDYAGSPPWTDTRVGIRSPYTYSANELASNYQSWGERDVGSSQTLADFLKWGKQALPAKNYAVVIFGHGSAYVGMAPDDTSGGDFLTPQEMSSAFSAAGVHAKLLVMEGCMMGQTEVAYELHKNVDYVVASEEMMWTPGMDYQQLSDLFINRTGNQAAQIAAGIVQTFGPQRDPATGLPTFMTLAALRTADSAKVTKAIKNFTSTVLATATADDWQAISQALYNSRSFGRSTSNPNAAMLRDGGEFFNEVSHQAPTQAIADAASAVLNTGDVLVSSYIDASYGDCDGESLLLPSSPTMLMSALSQGYSHLKFAHDTGWTTFLANLTAKATAPASNADWAESNDTFATATRLGRIYGELGLDGMTLNTDSDADWYEFVSTDMGISGHQVSITFDDNEANLDLFLYDANGNQIDSSTEIGSQETVSFNQIEPGEYYMKVAVSEPAQGMSASYSILFDLPGNWLSDWSEPADTYDKAVPIVLGVAPVSGLSLTAGDEDWFLIRTAAALDNRALKITPSYDDAGGDLSLQLYNSDQSLVASAQPGQSLTLSDAGGGTYYLKVYGTPSDTALPYSLSVQETGQALPQLSGTVVVLGTDLFSSLDFLDADGTAVHVTAANGAMAVQLLGDNIQLTTGKGVSATGQNIRIGQIQVLESSAKSAISVTATGGTDGVTTVDSITGASYIGTITAPNVNLIGSGIVMTGSGGIGRLSIGNLANGADITLPGAGDPKGMTIDGKRLGEDSSITVAAPIKSLHLWRWDSGGTLSAPFVSSITVGDRKSTVAGNFAADITLASADSKGVALGKLTVAGAVTDSTVNAGGGSIGNISAAQWNAGAINTMSLGSLKTLGSKTDQDIDGRFAADVNLSGSAKAKTTLGSASVAGLSSGAWIIDGPVGTIRAGSTDATWALAVAGAMKSLETTTGNMAGAIDVASVQTVRSSMGFVADITADTDAKGASIGLLQAGDMDSGSIDILAAGQITNVRCSGDVHGNWTASSIGTMRVDRSLSATITLTQAPDAKKKALGSLTVGTVITGTQVNSSGHIGTVTAGGIRNSSIFAGVDFTADDNADNVLDLPPTSAIPLGNTRANIGSIKITGAWTDNGNSLINSNIAASAIGSIALINADADAGSPVYGVTAQSIGSLSYSDSETPKHVWTGSDVATANLPGSLEVRLV